MAALRASLDVFDQAGGMLALRAKSEQQIKYLDDRLDRLFTDRVQSITPRPPAERGCQFALRITAEGHEGTDVHRRLQEAGVACDWREPDVIRVAPVPLYNSFEDIHRFVTILDEILS
jgi:kynureninase